MDYYKQIFKRKSFHLFRNTDILTESDISQLKCFISTTTPLYPEINTHISVVSATETSCKRGGEYCILFYSETKEGYLRNIGYIGEQIDLYLSSQNIGALWYGIGKPSNMKYGELDFVIMINISKMREDRFRKDMFKAKRKPLDEIWEGAPMDIANIIRFSPSACNTQPWKVTNTGTELHIYRYKKKGKRGIMPADKVTFYNKIDIGIFMFIVETCLSHHGHSFVRHLYTDNTDDNKEILLTATYQYQPKAH